MNRLVIVGCGRLGTIVADAVAQGLLPEYELVGLYSRTTKRAEALGEYLAHKGIRCSVCGSLEELLACNFALLLALLVAV